MELTVKLSYDQVLNLLSINEYLGTVPHGLQEAANSIKWEAYHLLLAELRGGGV